MDAFAGKSIVEKHSMKERFVTAGALPAQTIYARRGKCEQPDYAQDAKDLVGGRGMGEGKANQWNAKNACEENHPEKHIAFPVFEPCSRIRTTRIVSRAFHTRQHK